MQTGSNNCAFTAMSKSVAMANAAIWPGRLQHRQTAINRQAQHCTITTFSYFSRNSLLAVSRSTGMRRNTLEQSNNNNNQLKDNNKKLRHERVDKQQQKTGEICMRRLRSINTFCPKNGSAKTLLVWFNAFPTCNAVCFFSICILLYRLFGAVVFGWMACTQNGAHLM